MLTKESTLEITSLPTGEVQCCTTTIIKDGNDVVSQKAHYDVLAPGADLAGKDERVVKVAQATWTPEIVEAFTEKELAKHAEERAKIEAAIADVDAKKAELEAKQADLEKAKEEAAKVSAPTPEAVNV